MSVILAFIVACETAFRLHTVHGNVSPLTNRFLSVTGNRRLGFERMRYGRLFLAIAGLLVFIMTYTATMLRADNHANLFSRWPHSMMAYTGAIAV